MKEFVPEHLSNGEIAQYAQGKLAPADLLRLDDHLAACEACRLPLEAGERISAGITALRESLRLDAEFLEHSTHDQIVAYVDATLDEVDREIVDPHLETCRTCAEDVTDLRALVTQSPDREKLRPRVLTVVPMPNRSQAWRYAAVVLAAAAALAGVLVWSSRSRPQPPANVEAHNRGPEGVRAPNPSSTTLPPATPAIVLALKDGAATVTLDATGKLTGAPALQPSDRDALVAALQAGRIDIPPAIATLRGRPAVLLGAPATAPAFRPLRPVATAVDGTRPLFEWTALAGATSYVVSVFDADLDKVAESEPTSALQWTPSRPLPRGRIYSWQIRARPPTEEVISPTPPAPEARFRVLAQAEADRIAALRRNYAGSPLTLGVLLGRAAILDEAARQLEPVVAANPFSPVAQQLLASVRDARATRRAPR